MSVLFAAGLFLSPLACRSDSPADGETSTETGTETGTGDGDTDPGTETGDGDGDPGDGDGDPPPTNYEVGFDVTDLTPTEAELAEGFYLGGYGFYTERGAAEGIHDQVYVRTMAIGYGPADGGIFAVADAIGMGNQWTRAIRAEAAAMTGLSEEQIIIGSTHSHGAPDLQGLWGGVPEGYRARIITAIATSMATAWNDRVPADLEVASTTADNRNRRGWDFTDDGLFVVQARNVDGGALLGAMVAFAAHPVVLGSSNLQMSRDYCGYAVDNLEAQLEAPVLFFNGVQGDVSPQVPDGMYADDFERAQAYGDHVAARTMLALDAVEPVGVDMFRNYADFELDVTNETFLLAAQAGLLDYDFVIRDGVGLVATQTAYFRFGDEIQLVAFPGESLTRNGLPIKEAMTAPHQVVLGLSGDALGYFVPSDEWNTGLNDNYEESISVGMDAADVTRDLLIELMSQDPG
ncbi:hypothetical protein DB30_06943 [Enhygromyxa salina]|uniref:Neutral/alkaline non-lysosomal ceramidase n=1 Tax=Enhygromyxa salina TaxID=215803 RepID=A0A0C2CT51_9BACT|nr:hypothetical protein [Enhygromyxa salina]KIG14341.1 hypothetical protein DB30_06943 [Enhygromyxa salina]